MDVLTEMFSSEVRELVLLHILDRNICSLHIVVLLHERVPCEDVLRLGVDAEGQRPHVVQRILIETRSQSGCVVTCLSTWWQTCCAGARK